jgi:hypothetical protein
MIYEEEYEEPQQEVEEEQHKPELVSAEITEEIIEEKPIDGVQAKKQVIEADREEVVIGENILNPEKLKSPPSLSKPTSAEIPVKKVKVGGYFGQEVIVKPNGSSNNLVSSVSDSVISDTERSAQVEKKISITMLKPPRRITVKLCRMCGQTLIGTSTCSKCGFKN